MTNFRILTLSLLLFTVELRIWAQDDFADGVAGLQSQNYDVAQEKLEKALVQRPDQPQILFNLGLAHFRKGQKGWAAAYWRKALFVDPGLAAAQKALSIVEKELPHPSQQDEATLTDQVIALANKVPLSIDLGLLLGLLTWAGIAWAKAAGQRRRNREATANGEEAENVSFPMGATLATGLSAAVIAMASVKWIETQQTRATVIADKASLVLSPDPSAPLISEMLNGQEVTILRVHQDWAQVQASSNLTGWLQRPQLFVTGGRPVW